jgi:hypothetical protein
MKATTNLTAKISLPGNKVGKLTVKETGTVKLNHTELPD